jgi:hypothetical protein
MAVQDIVVIASGMKPVITPTTLKRAESLITATDHSSTRIWQHKRIIFHLDHAF